MGVQLLVQCMQQASNFYSPIQMLQYETQEEKQQFRSCLKYLNEECSKYITQNL